MSIEIDLSGENTLITGAGRGIGAEIARRFAEAGANIIAASRTEQELRSLVDELTSEYGVEAISIPTDLSDANDIENLINVANHKMGGSSMLINNAGANLIGDPIEHSTDEIDRMLDVNLRGTFILTQKWAKSFRESQYAKGRVINISSIVADVGVSGMTVYAGTKAGLRGLTRGLASALAKDGVNVNSVSPGVTLVERTSNVIESGADGPLQISRIPLGRVGKVRDTADATLFLASDLADYITGVDILVDGGVNFTAGMYK